MFVSKRRDLKAATKFFANAIGTHGEPAEVTTDRAHALVRVVTELLPAALHDTTQYANNRVEADHGRLKARLRPMRGLKRDRTASVVIRGHAFIQNLRRGHYELGMDALPGLTGCRRIRRACAGDLNGTTSPRLVSFALDDRSMQQSPPVVLPCPESVPSGSRRRSMVSRRLLKFGAPRRMADNPPEPPDRLSEGGCVDVHRSVLSVPPEWARGDLNPHILSDTGT